MPNAELFDDIDITRHAGASPWERYKKAKGGAQPIKIGWLTAEIPDTQYARLVRFAETHDEWRGKLIEAINGICDF